MTTKLHERIVQKPPKNGTYYIIGVDGRGGSGKTTLTNYLAELLPGFTIIHGDDYFEPNKTTIAWGSFNEERFLIDVLQLIKNTQTEFEYRPYDWHAKPHIRSRLLKITEGVIIERSFCFAFDIIYDLKIWVETPPKLALQRGQHRDEMPLEEGYRAWKVVWQPQEDAHIKNKRPLQTADIVIDGTKEFETQLR